MSSEVVVVDGVPEGISGNNENTEHNHHQVSDHPALTGKKLSWQKLRRSDSLDMESHTFPSSAHASKLQSTFNLI